MARWDASRNLKHHKRQWDAVLARKLESAQMCALQWDLGQSISEFELKEQVASRESKHEGFYRLGYNAM
jgi:hypothetical protein